MQFDSLLKMLRHIPVVAGLEMTILPDQEVAIRLAVVKRKWNTVSFEYGEYQLDSIQNAKAKIPAGVPLSVYLNGKGIIHRKVENSSPRSEEHTSEHK